MADDQIAASAPLSPPYPAMRDRLYGFRTRRFAKGYYDSEFSTQMMMENNPFNNKVMVNGLIVPLSSIPVDLQEYGKERAEGRDIESKTQEE